jgi:hypothetical protein
MIYEASYRLGLASHHHLVHPFQFITVFIAIQTQVQLCWKTISSIWAGECPRELVSLAIVTPLILSALSPVSASRLFFPQFVLINRFLTLSGVALHIESGDQPPYGMLFRRSHFKVVDIGRRPGGTNIEKRHEPTDCGRAMFRCPVISRKHAKITFSDSGHVRPPSISISHLFND